MCNEIARLREKGIEVALLNYDLAESNRSFSVTNNYSLAACMAAELMSVSLKYSENKNILLGTMSKESSGQNELYKEFKKAAERCSLQLSAVCESNEELISKITPNIMGIYVTHAKSIEVCKAVEKSYKTTGVLPTLIVSDLYDEMIPYIESDIITATVYQNPVAQAYDTVIKMYNILIGIETHSDIIVNPELFLKSRAMCRIFSK